MEEQNAESLHTPSSIPPKRSYNNMRDIVHRLKVVLEAQYLHLYNAGISGTPSSEEQEFKAH